MLRLESLRETARRAYSGTSMSPERRGDQLVEAHSKELEEDLAGIPEADRAAYESRYISFMRSWLSSESQCVSSWIAGPSNFPVARMNKRRNWAEAKYTAWQEWRKRALNGIERRIRRESRANINPVQEALVKLADLKQSRDFMKEVNALHKKYLKNPKALDGVKVMRGAEDVTEATLKLIRNYVPDYSWVPHPFAPYRLTNTGAEIRRMEGRVKELSVKEVLKTTVKLEEYPFRGGRVVVDHQADRVQIYHDEKPGSVVIKALKANAFHWTPSLKCWQRQLTNPALYATQTLVGIRLITNEPA